MGRFAIALGVFAALGFGAQTARANTVHATWTANPDSIKEGGTTRFTLTLRSSPDTGKFQATSFKFNAGTTTASPSSGNLNLLGNSSSPATLYVDTTYYQDGAYTARLTGGGMVAKPTGNKTTYFDYAVNLSTRVNVANVTPAINIASLMFPVLTTVGEAFTFNALASDPGILDTLAYKWDFNKDGVIDAVGQNPTFAYGEVGTYTGRVMVSDDDSFTFADFSVSVVTRQLQSDEEAAAVVPLPPAVWGGMALCGLVGAVRRVRRRAD